MLQKITWLIQQSHRENGKSMKKKTELDEDEQKLEILKAVAQAWYNHSGSCRPTNEFDAHRRNFRRQPSRFRVEAAGKHSSGDVAGAKWDFGKSLLDSQELLSVSKRIETGLVLEDNPFSEPDIVDRVYRKRRKSRNSLRDLFFKERSCHS